MATVREPRQDEAAPVTPPGVEPTETPHEVFDFLQHRILTHVPQATQILKREMPAPRTAIVYPTYVCNQDCVWCEYNAENTQHHAVMKNEEFRKVIDDLATLGVQGIEFCGGGEPTLHPILPEVVRDLQRRKIGVGLLTNGTKLFGELAEALVDHASYVRIGFDGGTEETVHRVKRPKTPGARFDAVCRNFRNLVDMRNARRTKCLISMKVVINQENMQEIEDCVRLALELGADSVQFKPARLCSTELTPDQAEAMNDVIAECRARYPELTIVGGMDKLNMTTQCWLTPLQVTIDTLGEVFLCCYYRHRKERHSIGNCFESDLSELWYAQTHWDKIDAIRPHECNNLDCRFVRYNQILTDLMIDNDAQFEFI